MVILDFPGTSRRVFRHPAAVLKADSAADVPGILSEIEIAAGRGLYAAGYVSYEAAPAFDRALCVCSGARMPLAWFGLYDGFTEESSTSARPAAVLDWSVPDRAGFVQSVARIREEIAAGHTYQVNLTARLTAQFEADPLALYESMRRAQGVGNHAYLDTGDFTILSASPELFFETRGRHIRTRPMKGTRARGRFCEEDERAARELAASEKDRAENLMIVDLLRNDLGRVAETGSVEVTSLFDVEQYRTVFQMTSVIEAQLGHDVTLREVFAALFPCGSVT